MNKMGIKYVILENRQSDCEWTNWHVIWVCHVEPRLEWLGSGDFKRCAHDGSHKPFLRSTKQREWHMAYHSHNNYLERIVISDETWVHYSTRESKCASMRWKHLVSSQTFKAVVCWQSDGYHVLRSERSISWKGMQHLMQVRKVQYNLFTSYHQTLSFLAADKRCIAPPW